MRRRPPHANVCVARVILCVCVARPDGGIRGDGGREAAAGGGEESPACLRDVLDSVFFFILFYYYLSIYVYSSCTFHESVYTVYSPAAKYSSR